MQRHLAHLDVMRLPTHLHITWQDDNTLKIDADFGMQTRLFHFAPPAPPSNKCFRSGAYRFAQPPNVQPPSGVQPTPCWVIQSHHSGMLRRASETSSGRRLESRNYLTPAGLLLRNERHIALMPY